MKIFYTDRAIHDLKRLRDFVALHNPIAALEISTKLVEAIKRLAEFPTLGKEIKSVQNKTGLRDLITGKYIIRYMALNNELHILRVWHGKEEKIFSR